MKKIMTIVAVAGAAALALDWNTQENLALNAQVVTSSVRPGEGDRPENITDGNTGSRWQAIEKANAVSPDWVIIDLGESKTFTDVEIIWENSHPKTYSVYVTETAIPYAQQNFGTEEEPVNYNVIDAGWLENATATFAGGEDSEAGYTETLTSETALTGRYILIYGETYNNWATDWGMCIYEVRVANIGDRDKVTTLTLNDVTVKEGATAEVKVEAKNAAGSVVDLSKVENLTLTCSEPDAVEISGGEDGVYSVKTLRYGNYTLTATCEADGETVTGSSVLTVSYVWKGVNIAQGKPAWGRTAPAEPTEDGDEVEEIVIPNPASNAVDGDVETYYEYNGGWSEGWVIVDLGKDHIIDTLAAEFAEKGNGDFRFAYAQEGAAMPEEDQNLKNVTLEGWTLCPVQKRSAYSTTLYQPENRVVARYIAVIDGDSPAQNAQTAEIYVAGEEYTAPQATSIEVSASADHLLTGEKVTLNARVLDQYGAEFPVEEGSVDFVDEYGYVNGNEFESAEKGLFEVKALYGELESAPCYIHVAAKKESYFFPWMCPVTFGDETLSPEDYTGHVLANTADTTVAEWNDEDIAAGKALRIDLGDECDIDMMTLRWEAACPKSYTVTLEDNAGNREVVEIETERGVDGNVTDRIYKPVASAPEGPARANALTAGNMTKVRYITVVPKESNNSNGWSNKLFGIALYGAPGAGIPTSVVSLPGAEAGAVDVYSISGAVVRRGAEAGAALQGLPKGVYVVNGKKIVI